MIDRNSNIYTLVYALLLAALVSGILAWVSSSLAPRREAARIEARDAAVRAAALLDASRVECLEDGGLQYFLCSSAQDTVVVLPCRGEGVEGEIWGYVALGEDFTSVRGVCFDHECETPGLGARIAEDGFSGIFRGRPFDADGIYASADALTGATKTSEAVGDMLRECTLRYAPLIGKFKKNVKEDELQ